jgi:flagellar biosynthesis/type III secretory pathway M-ring protein FliF/YscJ
MTDDLAQRQRNERGGVSTAFAIVLGLLIVGAIVGVLGVRSAVTATQDRDAIADYAAARQDADAQLAAGNQAVALGQQLCNCDVQTRDLSREQLDVAVSNNTRRYNEIKDQLNDLATQANALLDQLQALG